MGPFFGRDFFSEAANARLMLETFGPTVFFNATKLLVEGKPRGFVGSFRKWGANYGLAKKKWGRRYLKVSTSLACNV